MTPISEYLTEQKRLAEAATEGPWKRDWYAGVKDPKSRLMTAYEGRNHCLGEYLTEEDATFIAAARSSVPKLIAAVEAVMAVHERVETQSQYPMPPNWKPMKLEVCGHCKRPGAGDALHPWPCPTIRAIEAALGGEGDGK